MPEITTSEAAERLGVDPRAIRKAFAAKKIAGRKVTDRMTMLDSKSVDAFGKTLAKSAGATKTANRPARKKTIRKKR